MRKSILMKLLVLAVCAAMLLSLFACDGGKKEPDPTETTTQAQTEKPTETEKSTETPTTTQTEAPAQSETEPADESDDESTPADESDDESASAAETTDESASAAESTDESASSAESTDESASVAETTDESASVAETTDESASVAETTDESDSVAETTDESAPAASETEDESKETESETKDEPKETESETKDEPKETESETKDEPKETESEPKETESETESESSAPACDGNHPYKTDRGDAGHYQDACEICGIERVITPHTYETVDGKPTCSVCNYVASCQGVHTNWSYNDDEHWMNVCGACQGGKVERTPHTPVYADGKYACTECGYVYVCDMNHALTSNGESGHTVAACVICNLEAKTEAHTFVDKDGSRFCACGYEAACKGVHTWTSDAEGHQMAACDVCGAAAGEKVAHSDVKAEAVSATAYTYGCADCGYAFYTKNITAAVKQFLTPGYIANDAKVYYAIGSHEMKVAENGMPYASISGTGSTAQVIWVRAHEDMIWSQKATDAEQEGRLNIGKATYLVIALKTNNVEQHMAISFSTTGKGSNTAVATEEMKNGDITVAAGATYNTNNGYNSFNMPIASATADTWTTFVIDLAKVCPEQLVADENGDYIVDTLYYHLNAFAAETTLDVAYMAFVEGDWAAVAANVEAETVVSVTASGIGTIVKSEDGSCIGEHNYATVVADGYYKSVCACGATKDSYGVKAEGPDRFWGAEDMYGWVGFTGTADKEVIYDEDGTGFIRFSNTTVNADKWSDFHWSNGAAGATGQYMVMKYRIGENGLGQTSLSMYITSKPVSSWPKGSVTVKVSEDGQWHYLVIDLANRVATGGFEANEDGTYTVNYFSVRYFNGYQTLAQPDDYMDVSYVAFCDSIDDVKNIVDAETYEWSADANTTAIRYTADHSCAQHAWVEDVEGTTHSIKCSLCDHVEKTYNVSADINWYSSLGSMNKFQHNLEKLIYDEDEGVMFNRYTGTGGNHINITGGTGAGSPTSAKYSTGKYVVIKYRATGASLGFNVQTGDRTGGSVSLGTQSVDNLPGGEWRVAIVDLTAAYLNEKKASQSDINNGKKTDAEGYLVEDDGVTRKKFGYTTDSEQKIYFMITTGGSTPYVVDIAYVAVVDSIDEMKLLLQEGETYVDMGQNWAGTPVEYNQDGTKVPCKEGKCVLPATATITDGENGAKIYTYNCTVCGNAISTKTVPAGVIYMAPEILKTVTNATVVNPNAENANSPEVYAEKNDLHPQTHFGMTGSACAYDSASSVAYFGFKGNSASHKTAQFIWNRSYEDYTSNAPGYGRYLLDMGQSKYLVIKVRTNLADANGDEFSISISTKGQVGGSIKLPVQDVQGDWVTYVIDLETVLAEKWVKDAVTGTYIMDTFYFNFYNCLVDNSVDLAYVAFVEGDWSDVNAFVDEETVISVAGATDRTYDVRYADGSYYGTKEEEPIEVTFDADMKASVTVPADTTMYFAVPFGLSEGMTLLADDTYIDFVAGNRWMGTPSTFSLTNKTDEAITYTLQAGYPVGSQMNPEVIEDMGWYYGNVFQAAGDYDGYYYTYTAPSDGVVTFYFSEVPGIEDENGDFIGYTCDIMITNMNTYAQKTLLMDGVDNHGIEVTMDVKAGEQLMIIIAAVTDLDGNYYPEAEMIWVGTFTYPQGTESNPIYPEWNWDAEYTNAEITVTVGAGETVYFNGYAGMILTINGEVVEQVDGVFSITNDGEADAEYALKLATPAGAYNNPEAIEDANTEKSGSLGEGEAYHYIWTATKSGTITLTVTDGANLVVDVLTYVEGEEWPISVQYELAVVEYDEVTWQPSWVVAEQLVIEVVAGQQVKIQVQGLTDWETWTTPAIEYTLNMSFVEAEVDEPVQSETPTDAPVESETSDEETVTEEETEAPAIVVEDLSEINDLDDGTKVIITGTVTAINTAWSDDFGNISVYITDEFGESILVYRLSTKVAKGDIIVVTGVVGSYNGSKQIAQGATAEIIGQVEVDGPKEMTIAEALAAEDGTDVIVTGTVVKIGTAYSSSHNNISVYIKDDNGDELYLYRLAGNVSVGDIITVTGAMATYNGARQVAAGATFEMVSAHVCTSFTEATCTAPAKCVVCGVATGTVAEHADVEPADGKCDSCGANLSVATADESMAIKANAGTLASDSLSISWAGESFTVTAFKGTNNNAIRTSDSDHFRVYQGNDLKITGTGMTKIVITAHGEEKYIAPIVGSLTTAGVTAVRDGSTITITVDEGTVDEIAFTASAQFRINNITITYVEG